MQRSLLAAAAVAGGLSLHSSCVICSPSHGPSWMKSAASPEQALLCGLESFMSNIVCVCCCWKRGVYLTSFLR